jgi:hypothetical protein
MVACLIVLASFAIFVVQQSNNASGQQQEVVAQSGGKATVAKAPKQASGLHKAIDEASEQISSPFAGIVAPSQSEWGAQIVRLVLSLLVYGLGVGFVIRAISVRV